MGSRKQFTPEFKREALQLLESGSRPASELARELGIMKQQELAGRNTRSSDSSEVITMQKPKRAASRFLICVENKGYAVSLEKRKIYVALPDSMALKHGQVRVIDESGEDYLYPKSLFLPITIPQSLRKAILKAA